MAEETERTAGGVRVPGASPATVRSILPWGLVTGALVLGFWAGRSSGPADRLEVVRAASSLAEGAFAACTVPLDAGIEALFLLDFETGDLAGGVIGQANGKFTGLYKVNVLKDLGFKPGQAKNPKFLLVSGIAHVGRVGPLQMASSVLFVTDSATGTTVAYGIPTTPAAAGAGAYAELVRLDVVSPRGGGKTR
jgi:hypothetical protein